MKKYQWEELIGTKPQTPIANFTNSFGPKIIDRKGRLKVRFQIYTGDFNGDIFLVGDFNSWGKQKDNSDKFKKSGDFYYLATTKLKHGDSYLILHNNNFLRDPGTLYFDSEGNSILWDFESSKSYKFNHYRQNVLEKSLKIMQTDLPGLIYHFRDKKGILGSDADKSSYYRFVADSGVIDKITDLGFNAIQFLPISQSIDGDKWSFRYLVPFINSINRHWGSPDDFSYMIDKFHEKGIAVILDLVISHAPHKDYKLFDIKGDDIGLHKWDEEFDSSFLGDETSWGTRRYNYADPNIRKFVIESGLNFIKNYKIDGFRIDNIDGILRFGENGDGKERKFGRTILRELNTEIYKHAPNTVINFESHYFFGNNAKWLVSPLDSHKKALGATAYTSSRLTYYMHSEYMPKSADEVSPWKIKHIIDEKEWGNSNSTIADFHNHDAAAGLMGGRATGSYAYDALILKKPELHYHAVGKIKVMESIISFICEGRTLDLLQTHLLQTGTFEHDSSIKWYLEQVEASSAILNYKKAVNKILDDKAFWPINVDKRKIINLDEKSKSLVVVRSSSDEDYLIYINMSAFMQFDFRVPVPKKGKYKLILNSDKFKFAGSGRTNYEEIFHSHKVDQFEYFDYGIDVPTIPPYAVFVWKKI